MNLLAEIDLLGPVTVLPPATGQQRVLVRAGDVVLGEVTLAGHDLPGSDDLRRQLADRFAAQLWALGRLHVAAPPRGCRPEDLTVIVCTRDRPALLAGCLEALLRLDPAPGHLLVVDNAPTGPETATTCEALGVRRVVEPVAGLDRARNRGWTEATTALVAYVDDDARAHPDYARAVSAAFMADQIAAVTGLVWPAELSTSAQRRFELQGGMGKGYVRTVFHREVAAVGTAPHRMGVGTNMAFRRAALEALGGFDERLDVGTATRGGGDLDVLYRVIEGGHVVLYEPAAIVAHIHRREMSGLVKQSFDNGVSYAACLDKWQAEATDGGAGVRADRARWHLRRHLRGPLGALRRRDLAALRILLAEARGSRLGAAALRSETSRVAGRR